MPTPTDLASLPLGTWLASVALPAPSPGGGAVAAVVAGHAAALAEMAVCYSTATPDRDRALADAAAVRATALTDAARDAAASERLVGAFRRPADDPARATEVAAALAEASACSSAIVDTARRLHPVLEWAARHGEPRLLPDVAIAAHLLATAVRSAAVNIRCNATAPTAPGDDADAAARFAAELDAFGSTAVTPR